MSTKKHTKVFLDANIVIGAGKPPGGPLLVQLKYLVNAGLISILTTDLTHEEIAKKHAENDYKTIKGVGRVYFRRIVKKIMGAELPKITNTELKAKLVDIYKQSTEAMFNELKCKNLPIDKVKPSIVFSAYFTGEGFFTQEGKKNQFPDAFIFECLKAEASKKEPIIIVSKDNDYNKPVEGEAHMSLVKSLPELFEKLGLRDQAPDVEHFLKRHEQELVEAVNQELNSWIFIGDIGDVSDCEIEEMDVTEVKAMELMSFGSTEGGGPILVVGTLSVKADIWYIRPYWDEAMHSDDDMFTWDGDVSGQTEVSFKTDISMLVGVDKHSSPKNIKELRFPNITSQHIEFRSHEF